MLNVSFITVLYNNKKEDIINWTNHLINNLLYCYLFQDIEIIFIDNSEDSVYVLSDINTDQLEGLHLIYKKLEKNIGYCGGNNVGCDLAKNEYLFIINPDLYFKESLPIEWLYARSKMKDAIVGMYRNGKDWLTYPTMFPTDKKYFPEDLPFYYDKNPLKESPELKWKSLPFIDGSIMCFSKDLFNNVRFDENIFPGYFGENTFQYRALSKGYKLSNVPIDSLIEHRTNSDSIYTIEQKKIWTEESRKYFYKNYALSDYETFISRLV